VCVCVCVCVCGCVGVWVCVCVCVGVCVCVCVCGCVCVGVGVCVCVCVSVLEGNADCKVRLGEKLPTWGRWCFATERCSTQADPEPETCLPSSPPKAIKFQIRSRAGLVKHDRLRTCVPSPPGAPLATLSPALSL
jgi:hypothetical protein